MTRRLASPGEGLLVCAKQCDQCLFSKNRIVSHARMREILRETQRNDTYFQCHKHTMNGRYACCAGDYNSDPERTTGMRIAKRMNAIIFVDEDGYVVEQQGGK